jgi:hypothetical protein
VSPDDAACAAEKDSLITIADLRDKHGIEQLMSGSPSPAVSCSSPAAGGPDNPERLRCAIAHTESLIAKSKETLSFYTISKNTKMVEEKEQDLKNAKLKLKGEVNRSLGLASLAPEAEAAHPIPASCTLIP